MPPSPHVVRFFYKEPRPARLVIPGSAFGITWSGQRESDSHHQLGRLRSDHQTVPALSWLRELNSPGGPYRGPVSQRPPAMEPTPGVAPGRPRYQRGHPLRVAGEVELRRIERPSLGCRPSARPLSYSPKLAEAVLPLDDGGDRSRGSSGRIRTDVAPSWTDRESHPDLDLAKVASSCWTISPWTARELHSYFYLAEVASSCWTSSPKRDVKESDPLDAGVGIQPATVAYVPNEGHLPLSYARARHPSGRNRTCDRPSAPRTEIASVSLHRQWSCDSSRITRHSSPRRESNAGKRLRSAQPGAARTRSYFRRKRS
jgi:hypothetical protein